MTYSGKKNILEIAGKVPVEIFFNLVPKLSYEATFDDMDSLFI